jgi:Helix-turn-helix domain
MVHAMRVTVYLMFLPDRPALRAVVDDGTDRTVELELEMEDQHRSDDPRVTCTAVTVRRAEGVGARDLRFPLEEYLAQVRRHPALAEDDGRPRDMRTKRKRREMTDTFLREVADAYRAADDGQRVAAVRAAHHASESQVYRWLRLARERGLLDEAGE